MIKNTIISINVIIMLLESHMLTEMYTFMIPFSTVERALKADRT